MSIVNEIARIQSAKESIYEAIISMGGSLSSTALLDAYPSAILDLPTGGGSTITNIDYGTSLLDGTVVSYSNSELTFLKSYAFYSCSQLQYVDLPNVTGMGNSFVFNGCNSLDTVLMPNLSYATETEIFAATTIRIADFGKITHVPSGMFSRCYYLSSVNVSNITTISSYGFYQCSSLVSISLPKVTNIQASAFEKCISLTEMILPSCTYIGSHTFDHCTSLSSIFAPNLLDLAGYAFYFCSDLRQISFSRVLSVYAGAFYECYKLSKVYLKNCKSIMSSAFMDCSSLLTVLVGSLYSISRSAFYYCTSLQSLYILSTAVARLANKDALSYTPDSGKIYVPASLVTNYKLSTTWVTYANRFTSLISMVIDGSTYWAHQSQTWGDWVDNDLLNDNGFYSRGTSIYNKDGTKYIDHITPSDIIEDNTTYTLANW